MQIIIFSQSIRIIISVVLLLFGFGIISMIIGMLVGDIVNRALSYYSFYDKKIKAEIKKASIMPILEVMKIMAPNAFKIGLTTLGFFALSQAITLISPFYLSYQEVAQYGISKLMVGLIFSLGGTWFGTFYPQMTQYRVRDENESVKRLYVKGILIVAIVFLIAGSGLILLGNPILVLIHSKTFLLNSWYLLLMIIFSFFEVCQSISTSTLLTKNEVPYFKSVLFSGGGSLILLFIMFRYTHLGVLSMILAPGIALSIYHNWKWPYTVIRDLKIKPVDFYKVAIDTVKTIRIK